MTRLLTHFFRRRRKKPTARFDTVLQVQLDSVRAADPETQAQWLHVQRMLSQQVPEPRGVPSRLMPRLAFGVVVVAALIVGGYFYVVSVSPPGDTFVTERGQQTRLVLQDSSEVMLNYATELVVQKLRPDTPRRLSLKGEAYFRVHRNETPFIVSTDVAEVQVIGTEFNLRSRDGVLEVAVTKGIVRVTASKDGKDSSLTLTQNEMAVVAQNNFPGRTGNIPSPEYPGWMKGRLFFNRTPFEVACRELEMRFDVTIKFEDGNVRKEVVTGVLHAGNADAAIAALCGLTGRAFRQNGQEYLIY